ncbi:alanine--tRNA ligase, chloroplastic/mitochondrial isoform X2 [Tanacetum coccineum]
MLVNFIFGDYFKKEAIKWAWELSTKEYGLTAENLWISVYEDDEETYAIWHDEIGVPANRIKKIGEEHNFWTSGPTGPYGPCSEIYYDFHPDRDIQMLYDLNDDTRFIEFYNLVFMQFNKREDVPDNYETDLIFPIIEKVSELANVSYALVDDFKNKTKITKPSHVPSALLSVTPATWHQRLGHPGAEVLRSLISRNFISFNKEKSSHICHACQLGKHVKLTLVSSDTRVSSSFDIIHSDIWTSPISPSIALSDPNWCVAMYDEYNALVKNNTWMLIPKLPNANVVRSMLLFRHKYHADGPLSRDPISDPTLYRSLAGGLQYLTFTHPDISYAVQQVCLHMHDPREPHMAALKRVL